MLYYRADSYLCGEGRGSIIYNMVVLLLLSDIMSDLLPAVVGVHFKRRHDQIIMVAQRSPDIHSCILVNIHLFSVI